MEALFWKDFENSLRFRKMETAAFDESKFPRFTEMIDPEFHFIR
jgi:hypothetical protein